MNRELSHQKSEQKKILLNIDKKEENSHNFDHDIKRKFEFSEAFRNVKREDSFDRNGLTKEKDIAVPDKVLYNTVLLMFNVKFNKNYKNLTQAFGRGSPWVIGQEFDTIAQNQKIIDFLIKNDVLPRGSTKVPSLVVEQLRNKYESEHNTDNDYHS